MEKSRVYVIRDRNKRVDRLYFSTTLLYNKELLKSSIMLKKYKNYTFTIKKKIEDEKINSEIVFKSFIFFGLSMKKPCT